MKKENPKMVQIKSLGTRIKGLINRKQEKESELKKLDLLVQAKSIELNEMLNQSDTLGKTKEFRAFIVDNANRWQLESLSDIRVSMDQFRHTPSPKSKFSCKATEFKTKLDREILRLVHGGRICEFILVGEGEGMKHLFYSHPQHSQQNYAGIPMYVSKYIMPFCFIIKSIVGDARVMGRNGWVKVATSGYDIA